MSYTPPDRRFDAAGHRPVRRRHVIYVPGYDPEAETRYRMLFVRELIRYAKRFGLKERTISPVEKTDAPRGLRWTVAAAGEEWRTETTFEVLRWDDIVRRDFARPLPLAILMLFGGLLYTIATGMMVRFWRLNWKFGGVTLYPPVMVLLTLGLGLGLGWGIVSLARLAVDIPSWAGWLVALAAAYTFFRLTYRVNERWFVWHLLHDWLFNWQHGVGLRPDYEAKVDLFAARLAEVARQDDADEILVVGHSSGAVMAVEVVARALELTPGLGSGRARIALLTMGSCLPLVALNPRARRCREGIARIAGAADILWVEYQAPQDWLNFAGFNPVRDLRLEPRPPLCFNPVIRSSKFREIVSPKTYRSLLFRPFRLHFQFLMANDNPGEFDYIMMVTGPVTLAERVDRGTGPGGAVPLSPARVEE
ncbi:alpha/beta hydrolase [Enterovirga sp. DB1703]|uniref:Alpha/beta hydrolase n=1 Tax=Enterovirga aerilata TaxID=2730920 RepID=A0A849IFG7_9HYPH|nr:alpha/beta hydrolase [Enterovirga sp. DB1703]